jgi:hypothetical protein
LYSINGFWLGLPTGRGSRSAMSRSKLSLAGMRMAYLTPFLQRLVDRGPGKGRIPSEGDVLRHRLLPFDLWQQELFPALALCTLPGRSWAARRSPFH